MAAAVCAAACCTRSGPAAGLGCAIGGCAPGGAPPPGRRRSPRRARLVDRHLAGRLRLGDDPVGWSTLARFGRDGSRSAHGRLRVDLRRCCPAGCWRHLRCDPGNGCVARAGRPRRLHHRIALNRKQRQRDALARAEDRMHEFGRQSRPGNRKTPGRSSERHLGLRRRRSKRWLPRSHRGSPASPPKSAAIGARPCFSSSRATAPTT
jgi:hypothetical protein